MTAVPVGAPTTVTVRDVVVEPLAPTATPSRTLPAPASTLWAEDLGALGRDDLLVVLRDRLTEAMSPDGVRVRLRGLREVLSWLDRMPGGTWTERWQLADGDTSWDEVCPPPRSTGRHEWSTATSALVAAGALTPGWAFLMRTHRRGVDSSVLDAPGQSGARELRASLRARGLPATTARLVEQAVAKICVRSRRPVVALRVDDVRDYEEALRAETRRRGKAVAATARPAVVYQALLEAGLLPEGSPTNYAAVDHAQRTVPEIVAGLGLRTGWFAALLVEYLEETRASGNDLSSVKSTANALGTVFWREIEKLDPDPRTLRLSDDTATAWKKAIELTLKGKPRAGRIQNMMQVRAFYRNLREWSHDDPRWAPYVAPSPVTARDLQGLNKHRTDTKSDLDQTTRQYAVLLPRLRRFVLERTVRLTAMLTAAEEAGRAGTFTFEGASWNRVERAQHIGCVVEDESNGARLNLSADESEAFWTWAFIEVLMAVGPRIEEVLELTERSLVIYTRPNGKKVPLLHILPSKSGRERLLPLNQGLLRAVKQILRRLKQRTGAVPALMRRDEHEELWSLPLPFLFQRRVGGEDRTWNANGARSAVNRALRDSGLTLPDKSVPRLGTHDFRRLFATNAVNSGLPVHVAAELLGHRSLNTTMGYVAVFTDDTLTAYLNWVGQVREKRRPEDYRHLPPVDEAEVDAYFDGRRVQGGTCVRTFGEPCVNSHNCPRCPLVALDRDAGPHLAEQEAAAQEAHVRARREGWDAQCEGARDDLTAIKAKQADLELMQAADALPPAPDLVPGTPTP